MSRIARTTLVGLGLATLLAAGWPSTASAIPSTDFVISEVMFDPIGPNNNRQWVELYNGTGATIDLSTYSLGWGRFNYTAGSLQLVGNILAGEIFLVGGPISDASNGFPVFDQLADFAPNLPGPNGFFSGGVALFDVPAPGITASLAPIHAVIYGRSLAFNLLIDESGAVGASLYDTDGFVPGTSIEFHGDLDWRTGAPLTPGSVPATIPDPDTATLMLVGLLLLRATREAQLRGLIEI